MARAFALSALLVVVAGARVAAAAADGGVVLESYGAARPADADKVLQPLRDELGHLGFATDARHSRDAGPMSAEDFAHASELVTAGWDRWLGGDFAGAIERLDAAVGAFRGSPATVAQDQKRRDLMLKALVGLAMANKRLGKTDEAARWMAELVRTFPDRQ